MRQSERKTHPGSLPIRDEPINDEVESLKWWVDMVEDVDPQQVDADLIQKICEENRIHDLPPPLGFRESPRMPYKLQLAILKGSNDKLLVLKHIVFEDKVTGAFVQSLAFGKPHMIQWNGNIKLCCKASQYLWECIGGMQVRSWTLTPEKKSQETDDFDEDALVAGFDFIESEAARATHMCLPIVMIWRRRLSCPIGIFIYPTLKKRGGILEQTAIAAPQVHSQLPCPPGQSTNAKHSSR